MTDDPFPIRTGATALEVFDLVLDDAVTDLVGLALDELAAGRRLTADNVLAVAADLVDRRSAWLARHVAALAKEPPE